MNKKEFLKEIESHQKEKERTEELRRLNDIRNKVIVGSFPYRYEYAEEFFLVEPHDNDMYIEN